jgi:ubiquinone biosynthesis protein Coq4
MAEYKKKVRQILRDHSCYFVRHGRGDHDIWHSPITERNITEDGEIRIRHVATGIMK